MTDREALATALGGTFSDGTDDWRLIPMSADGGIAPGTSAGIFADAILAALADAGYVVVKAEDAERLRKAIDAELALIVPSVGPFESGAAAAYHWVLAVLSGSTKP